MSKLTATHQRNAVSEGAALGLLVNGRPRLPYKKLEVDLAFAGAWRGWTYIDSFPQVNTDISKGLHGSYVMTRAEAGKHTSALFWEVGRELVIRPRATFEGDEEAFDEMLPFIGTDVPLDGWTSLAREFLTRFDR